MLVRSLALVAAMAVATIAPAAAKTHHHHHHKKAMATSSMAPMAHSSMKASSMSGHKKQCRDSKGRFTKCPKT